ncbi:MAG: DMT family transporter [Mycobacterium sp.]
MAISAALLAAFWAAVGIVVRQRAAHRVPAEQTISAAMAAFREPLWWAGTLAAVGGYVFQAVALANGSLLLVQPLLVSSLLFALPMSARASHQRITWAEWGWATLLTAALIGFVIIGRSHEGSYHPPIPPWALALAVTVAPVAACVIGARRATGRVRAMLLGGAVAVLLGTIAVLTKVCTHRFAVGRWHALLTVPAPYVLIALAAALTVLQQAAFHAGALQASVPIMLVGEPIVAVLLGVLFLGERLTVRGPALPVLVAAVVAMVVAAIALGRSEAAD